MWAKALLLLVFVTYVIADDLQQCLQCVQQNQTWCPGTSTCGNTKACQTPITLGDAVQYIDLFILTDLQLSLNCPRLPDPAYAYNETFVRYYITPLVAGVFPSTPEKCLKSQLPYVAFYKTVDVKCATEMPDTYCHCYTAWDKAEKAIIIAFRGTDGSYQMDDEILSFFEHRVPFFDNGHLFKYFHDAFFFLWNGGLEQQVRTLKFQYPDYKFYVSIM
ncbi:hypothetical protein TELCIR_08109 [Teladorsagia circumcincta]|uniref:Fungal lipase-type domain-containing protein n=1 Tax=Teladorsagia circumcincta TaxID=45464 RepID=A0A2G9UIH6_TELCI|nr:hypothetical protein TELCIR_08109 [Teladorsagia circumcincta]